MKEQKINRDKWLHIRVSTTEYKKLRAGFADSTNQKLSEYTRRILFEKPITVYTRNRSFDEFIAEMILLRNELKAIGNNFNQVVRKLNAADDSEEIKHLGLLSEKHRILFIKKMEEINSKIAQISDQWSQE